MLQAPLRSTLCAGWTGPTRSPSAHDTALWTGQSQLQRHANQWNRYCLDILVMIQLAGVNGHPPAYARRTEVKHSGPFTISQTKRAVQLKSPRQAKRIQLIVLHLQSISVFSQGPIARPCASATLGATSPKKSSCRGLMLVCRLPNFFSAQFKRMMSAAVAATAVPTKTLSDAHGPLPVVCKFPGLGLQLRWLAFVMHADCCVAYTFCSLRP